jgi:hypothetical protein
MRTASIFILVFFYWSTPQAQDYQLSSLVFKSFTNAVGFDRSYNVYGFQILDGIVKKFAYFKNGRPADNRQLSSYFISKDTGKSEERFTPIEEVITAKPFFILLGKAGKRKYIFINNSRSDREYDRNYIYESRLRSKFIGFYIDNLPSEEGCYVITPPAYGKKIYADALHPIKEIKKDNNFFIDITPKVWKEIKVNVNISKEENLFRLMECLDPYSANFYWKDDTPEFNSRIFKKFNSLDGMERLRRILDGSLDTIRQKWDHYFERFDHTSIPDSIIETANFEMKNNAWTWYHRDKVYRQALRTYLIDNYNDIRLLETMVLTNRYIITKRMLNDFFKKQKVIVRPLKKQSVYCVPLSSAVKDRL